MGGVCCYAVTKAKTSPTPQNITMAELNEYGGFDFEFVRKVADRYLCQICTKVLRKPHLAVCCGQHFCESCLKEWFRKNRGKESCPHCRAEGEKFNHVINKGLRSEINQLQIKCSNHSDGCKWRGELDELEPHLSGCGFVAVKCPNKCQDLTDVSITIYRKELQVHLSQECDLRPYQCEYCSYNDTYTAITGRVFGRQYGPGFLGGHQTTCPDVPLSCPNECEVGRMKRKDMERHRNKCSQELLECPFAEAGCKEKFRRFQLEGHVGTNQQQHLLLMMKSYKETKKELIEVKGALTTALQLLKQGKDADKEVVEFLIKSSTTLAKNDDSAQFVMPRFTEHRRSGKVWRSPPFYYREGYKMCLAVYANGVGYGTGTHISVSLLLLQNEKRKLPMRNACARHTAPYLSEGQEWFNVCVYQPLSQYSEAITELIHKEKFCHQKSSVLRLVNDCLAFNVTYANDCCLIVSVR